jgi:hypothetical protein
MPQDGGRVFGSVCSPTSLTSTRRAVLLVIKSPKTPVLRARTGPTHKAVRCGANPPLSAFEAA